MLTSETGTLTRVEIETLIDQFHDHIDRAITSTCQGRRERAKAYLAAARRLIDVLPADDVDRFELTGHLAGVVRGLRLDTTQPQPTAA